MTVLIAAASRLCRRPEGFPVERFAWAAAVKEPWRAISAPGPGAASAPGGDSGTVTLLHQAASADVVFLVDDDAGTVTGIRVDVVLTPDGPGLPADLKEIPSAP
ncbi:hypothetical protein I5Q34_07615 [Streptomyces sp. AV19]|uniref:hypothetical protein n=1 Tax=Streptomyces sp. AV19 TaxID=2793068 RepID=UPI0018FE7863|nr:hypothetical protein [Streptomyces sp. AV19]MBH1934164.1 hypothetical protein [Streptomyces sp. AV19]